MPYRDPARKAAYQKDWYRRNIISVKARAKAFQSNPENRPQINRYWQKRSREVKEEVLSHYGVNGTLLCCWPLCNIRDLDMLTLDHIANNGAEERKQTGILGGKALYRKLRREGFPNGYQTLCANHQFKKEILRKRGEL